uniref:Nuclear condensin complex subunit 3 C-terminal domain-containing protein n=1 Tax=Glossina pallidipes TaxID=7398 RepID=A0A1A9Z578_GLOPL
MGRKRKVPIPSEEKENEEGEQLNDAPENIVDNGPIRVIMSKIQLNETCHNKYIKELSQVYTRMDHDGFIYTFVKMIKTAMGADETNEYANMTLMFCAKFITSFEGEETHPVMVDVFRWLLTTISYNPNIRFRLCQFVNLILNALGQEATLDDPICDSIMEYMIGRCVDVSPNVRVQAILAMQRLQVPDNPDDAVLRIYQYHLCSDPSPRVRQTVITCMGRNYHTIPYILDRLSDIDEKVRRHTYLHMSSYPVRSYKVSQRLTLLEQGLNDRSDCVRKVVTNIMLQQWIESYQKNLVALIEALKLDSSPAEIDRFRKISRQALKDIFKRQENADLVSCLVLETEGDFYRCVPHEKLTMEMTLYWQCLVEYFQADMAEELDLILPELSTFCAYVENYCQTQKDEMDKFELMEFQYKLLSLVEILYSFDLGDEIGRGNLQKLLAKLVTNFNLNEKVIEVMIRCSENLLTDQNARHQFFLDIIHDICGLNGKQQDLVHDRHLISELLANSTDAQLNLKLSSLKVKILDLEEQEMNFAQQKDSVRVQQIVEEKNMATEEFTILLQPLLERYNGALSASAQPQFSKVVKSECILRSLQIAFHMVVSKRVTSLGHATCRLYHDFIFRHIASNQISIRDWALKCAAAFSMHYEPLAKDVFSELYSQFFRNHNIRIWETAITCIFELLDIYGVENFVVQDEQSKSKKAGRQLYTTLEFVDGSEDEQLSTTLGQGVGVIYMMSHFLDTCEDACIVSAIVNGFCRLILHGQIDNRDIMEKLLSRYFNPSTEPEINQILGIFLENLIQSRKQSMLQVCIMATINSILSAPYDSPLHDIRPDTITRFIIDATRPDSSTNKNEENIHNQLALTFLNEMVSNANNKELCKLLAKELLTLEVNVQKEQLKNEMKELADKLIQSKLDPHTTKKIIDFKVMLDGIFNPTSERPAGCLDSDYDEGEETEAGTYGTEHSSDQEHGTQPSSTGNATTNKPTGVQETTEHIGADKPNDEDNILIADGDPSVCIMATINSILSAPYDSPLHDIRPDTITRFIIDATRPDSSTNKNEENIHNQLALTFLNEMVSNANNKELCKLLAKELLTLEVNVQKEQLKNEMKELADKLIQSKLDPHTTKKIIDFKDMLDGIFNPTSKRPTGCLDSDYDEEEDTEAGTYGTEHSRDQEQGTQPSLTGNATTNKPTGVPETTEHIGADKPNGEDSILIADGDPSVCTDAPTTFGSDNNTSHRFLRKSLNASRNNSIESYPETIHDIQRPNKIRIEARIDSDKKANGVAGNSAQSNARATRSLRLAQRTQKIQTQNSRQTNNKRENKKMQEPKIIEKIINPKQLNSAVQHKSGKKYQKPSTPREARNLAGDKARGNDEERDNPSEKDSIGVGENASNNSIRYSQDVDGSSQQKPGRKIQKSLGTLEVSDSLRNKEQDNGGGKENAEVDNSSQHKPEGKSHKSLGPEKVSDALRNKHHDNGGGRENTRKKVSASEREQREKNPPGENVRLTRSRKITKENNAEKEKQDNSKKNKQDFEATRDNEADKEVQQIFENASDRLRHMANRINIDESNSIVISSDEEVNTSEIIPPSPEAISSTSVLRVHTRKLRVNLCQSKGNTTDLSTARSNSRTPLRSGRKRVLRTSPRLLVAASSAIMRSPPRKQQRTEIALKTSTVTRTQTKESVTKVSSLPISLRRKESRKDTCGGPTTSRQKQKDNIDGTPPKRKPAMMTRSASKKLVTTKWRLPLRRVSSRTSRQSLTKRSHIPVSAQFGAKRTQAAISASEKLNNNNNVRASDSKIPISSSLRTKLRK